MLDVNQVADFEVDADALWGVVGSFTGFGEALGVPVTSDGDGVGANRTVTTERGVMVEQLEHLDDTARTMTYALTQPGPLPVADYRSTMSVTATGPHSSRLQWNASFDAADGTSDAKAKRLITNIYGGTIGRLQELFDATSATSHHRRPAG